MRTPLLAALTVVMTLGACSTVRESRVNPFNWFGRSTEETVDATVLPSEAVDTRPLVSQVVGMRVERVPGGAIVHAMGLPPTQGYWDTDLVLNRAESKPDVLVFDFRLLPPFQQSRQGNQQSREVSVGRYLTTQDMQGIRTIVVRGQQNLRSVNR